VAEQYSEVSRTDRAVVVEVGRCVVGAVMLRHDGKIKEVDVTVVIGVTRDT
jgi:hypothetical protein